MSMRTIAWSSSNRKLGQRPRQLGLADAGRAEEQEAAERPVGVLQPGPGPADGVGHRDDGFVLADDALVQPRLHLQQLLDLALHQLADRDVRPLGDDLGDVLLVDFLLQQPRRAAVGTAASCVGDLLLELGDAAVLQLGGLGVVALRAARARPPR